MGSNSQCLSLLRCHNNRPVDMFTLARATSPRKDLYKITQNTNFFFYVLFYFLFF